MVSEGGNGFIKKGTFTNEIVWGSYSYIFPCMNKKAQVNFKKGMFLFGMVRKDSRRYLKNNEIVLPKKYAQIEYRKKLDENLLGKIAGADLNHAYWRIAYKLGILSEQTYVKGLDERFKSVRLAALSTMGASKKYQIVKDGKLTDETVTIKAARCDEGLQEVYVLIRLTCYKYMAKVKRLLGKDFLCYKTDAIYYIDTKENRLMVRNFFRQNDLLMKQLV